ncbi:hypothetical protein SD10_06295 [Spirosoma radiotolerans]|uniref:Uncharacterized protein n=2 Tax=Spirosoma radiotolerans TaxID=1379870 RepID=A0A0E3ZTE7_9BACT|nr:hypothetical protein SD10_06295 [Spirosoma radiotolerans]
MGLMLSCSKDEPTANSLPIITFKAIQKMTLQASATKAKRDSVIVTISFTDGDGDLGEDTRDSTRLKTIFGNQPWGNYQIRTFQLVNNKFDEIIRPDNDRLFVDLGNSTILPQVGMLSYTQVFPYTGPYKLLPVKFQLRMRDRNLNESNVVETDTVRLPIGF